MHVQGYARSLDQEDIYHLTITVVTKMHLQNLHIQVVVLMHRIQRGGPAYVHQSRGRATRSVPYLQCPHPLDTLGLCYLLFIRWTHWVRARSRVVKATDS